MEPTKPILHMFIHDVACQLWPHYVMTFSDLGMAADAHVGTEYDDRPFLIAMQLGPASVAFNRFQDEYSDARITISSSFVDQENFRLTFLDYENNDNNAWFKRWVDFLEYETRRLVRPPQPFPEAIPRDLYPHLTVAGLRELLP